MIFAVSLSICCVVAMKLMPPAADDDSAQADSMSEYSEGVEKEA